MTIQQQQERCALNDGIEDAYINTATYAAGIRTYYVIHRGVLKDLYESFYFNFAVLIELTEGLEELSKDRVAIDEAHRWFEQQPNGSSESEIKRLCDGGLEAFTKVKTAMSARGLLALPSKGR